MAINITTITNNSPQTVPILVGDITLNNANESSDLPPARAEQLQIPPGSEINIETARVDIGQLEQLQRLGLITFTAR